MTKEWVIKLHVFGNKFQIPNDTFSDTLLPLGLKTEFLTQYNNSEKNCSVIYAVVGFYREKNNKTKQLISWCFIWMDFFYHIKIQIESHAKINVVHNAIVLTSRNHVSSRARGPIPHIWELNLIHRLHVQCVLKAPQLCIFLTDIDYHIQLTYISLCTHLKCLWLPYKKCKKCPQHLTLSWLQHSAISATVFN